MLAKLLTGSIDPRRLDTAIEAVGQRLVPGFVGRDGALHGYWMADRATGQVVTLTLWRDRGSADRAVHAEGAERAVIAEAVGLRVHAVQVLPVLAAHTAAPPAGSPVIRWVRITWVDGVMAPSRDRTSALHDSIVEDQSADSGFCASYWIGDEAAGEGCAVSFWEHRADLTMGAAASRRRRRRVERALHCRVGVVHQYQALGVTPQHRSAGEHRSWKPLHDADAPLVAPHG